MPRVHMPFRVIEQRFAELDEVQRKLNDRRSQREVAARRRETRGRDESGEPLMGSLDTNGGAENETATGGDAAAHTAATTRIDRELDVGATSRVRAAVHGATSVTRERLHGAIAGDVGRLRARAARAMAEQRAVEEFCGNSGPMAGAAVEADEQLRANLRRGLPEECATFMTERGGQSRFEPLFADDDPVDRMKQAKAIARIIAAESNAAQAAAEEPRGAAQGVQGATATGPAAEHSTAGSSTSTPRRKRGPAHPPVAAPQASPYANPKPPAMRKTLERPQTAATFGTAGRPPPGADLATHFFNQLPPVIPVKSGVKQLARRFEKPPLVTSFAGTENAASSRAATPSAGFFGDRPLTGMTPAARTALQHFNADDAIFTKEFYYLHVKIVHTQAKLHGWEFCVTITDVTDPQRLLRHTFKNLRVNENMHIVFKPPGQVFLSPVDDIPWVAAPEALFLHTLRIEVYSTHPTKSKVVDSMVFFGDVIPRDGIATVAAQPPSATPNLSDRSAAAHGGPPSSMGLSGSRRNISARPGTAPNRATVPLDSLSAGYTLRTTHR
jgi:hypothetical protein